MKRTLLASAALTALTTAPALAENIFELDEIILFGGLTPVEAESYGRSVTVLDAEEMATRGIKTVEDALRTIPGVAISTTGNLTNIRLRGGEANHVLLLVDGVEMNSGGGSDIILRGLSVSDIERIEVLKGPQSTLYGSNAASGVIAITTKRATDAGSTYGGSVELGSNSTINTSLFSRSRYSNGELNFSLDTHDTRGEDGSRYDGGDTEHNRSETLNLTGRFDLSDRVTAGFSLRRSWTDYGYEDNIAWGASVATPDLYQIESNAYGKQRDTYASLWTEIGNDSDSVKHRLNISGNHQLNYGSDQYGAFDNKGSQSKIQYIGSFALDKSSISASRSLLNIVAETEHQSYYASWFASGTPTRKRDTNAIAAEYRITPSAGFDLQFGLRHDFNSTFEDATTWNASASYQLPNRDIRLRTALGSAVVNPTMTEQYGSGWGSFTSNPNLKPEEVRSAEIGAEIGLGDRGTFGATAYYTETTNLIQNTGSTSVNLAGTSRAVGLELETDYQVNSWLTLTGSYARVDAKTSTGARQQRRPEHELHLSAQAETFGGRGFVNMDLRHVAGNWATQWFASGTPVAELPAFTTLDLSAGYDLTANTELTLRVTNLTDKDYQDAWGYYANGREIFVGVNSNW